MKPMLITALAMSLAAVSPAWADDAHHPDQAPAATAPAAATPAPAPEKTIQRMRDNTATMQSQLDALAAAKTPDERQKLLMDHMQTMRENMMLGQQIAAGDGSSMGCHMMGGKGMMGGGMGMMGGMMGGDASGASPDAMTQRMQQMERRMDMMQMMMERTAAPARKAPAK
ncbi:hypothetical protein GPA22_11815 [Aromatoleum toluvorans]|uniref:Signal recognition particle subunit FFH/SRP54 (Srp54) n=1 Tax=Aromatoleum toluvorans TaxID=92002 RepID=A0ABX1PY95_9RHOO|nr:hypothetical protein [Aromatoleum toluvorans]NMG44414.1 hypothetical protein [Aromatoleum toluvorans]